MRKYLTLFATFSIILVPLAVLAQTKPMNIVLDNPLAQTTICQLFKTLLGVAITLAIPVMVLYLVYGGFRLITARGGDNLNDAKKYIVNTLIGIALFLGAWTLAMIVAGTINSLSQSTGNTKGSIISC